MRRELSESEHSKEGATANMRIEILLLGRDFCFDAFTRLRDARQMATEQNVLR
jgi:hypothetical protein